MLALGSDAILKAMVLKEMHGVADAADRVQLADDWWSLAEKEGFAKQNLQHRATYWYRKVLPGVSGLVKDKVERRIQTVGADSDGSPSSVSDEALAKEGPEHRHEFLTGQAAVPAAGSREPALLPVPDTAAQAEATKLIKEVYGNEWAAAKTETAKQSLAKKLLQKAHETDSDSTARFVLLRMSKDIATRAKDEETAFEAMDGMNKSFQIDAVQLKVGRYTSEHVCLHSTNDGAAHIDSGKGSRFDGGGGCRDNFAAAEQLKHLAIGETAKATDKSLIKQASERAHERNE